MAVAQEVKEFVDPPTLSMGAPVQIRPCRELGGVGTIVATAWLLVLVALTCMKPVLVHVSTQSTSAIPDQERVVTTAEARCRARSPNHGAADEDRHEEGCVEGSATFQCFSGDSRCSPGKPSTPKQWATTPFRQALCGRDVGLFITSTCSAGLAQGPASLAPQAFKTPKRAQAARSDYQPQYWVCGELPWYFK